MRNTPSASRSRIACAPAADARQVQTATRGIELPQRPARLQRRGDHAVVDEFAFHDMGGVADRRFHRADLAAVELKRECCLAPPARPTARPAERHPRSRPPAAAAR
jgi:hypothetical protein